MVTFVWMILGDRIRITWDYVEILTIRISIPRRIRSAQPMRSRDKLRSTHRSSDEGLCIALRSSLHAPELKEGKKLGTQIEHLEKLLRNGWRERQVRLVLDVLTNPRRSHGHRTCCREARPVLP